MRRTTVHTYFKPSLGANIEQHDRRLDDLPQREKYERSALTLADIEQMFREEVKSVWGEKVLDYGHFEFFIDPNLPLRMRIHTSGVRPYAIGRSMIRMNKNYSLKVRPDFLNEDKERVRRVIRHEVLHLGHMTHSSEFFRLAQEVGAEMTGEQGDNPELPPYQAQIKKDSRYVTIKRFNSEVEAYAWLKNYIKENKIARGRIRV